MNHCLVIGQHNVGKTLLSFRLAQLCGMKSVFVLRELDSDPHLQQVIGVNEAIHSIIDGTNPRIVDVQTIGIGMSQEMGQPAILYDSVGLSEKFDDGLYRRRQMARTLDLFVSCDLVLHVVDASTLVTEKLSLIDTQIKSFARARRVPYVLVANKADLLSMRRQHRSHLTLRQDKPLFVSAKMDQGLTPLKHVLERTNMVNYSYPFWMRGVLN